jgi:hypothetical protein
MDRYQMQRLKNANISSAVAIYYRLIFKKLIVKNFQVQSLCVMDNHRSKTAKIREFCLANNTLLGVNELKYPLPTGNVFVHISPSY